MSLFTGLTLVVSSEALRSEDALRWGAQKMRVHAPRDEVAKVDALLGRGLRQLHEVGVDQGALVLLECAVFGCSLYGFRGGLQLPYRCAFFLVGVQLERFSGYRIHFHIPSSGFQ